MSMYMQYRGEYRKCYGGGGRMRDDLNWSLLYGLGTIGLSWFHSIASVM